MSIIDLAPAAEPRALLSAAALGSIVGLVIGGAYLAGGMARTSADALRAAAPSVVSAPALASQAAPPMTARVPGASPSPSPLALAAAAPPLRPRALLSFASLIRPASHRPIARGEGDLQCLTQAVYYEARGEAPEGQAAVAQVVLNRVRDPSFPKSVCGVVFQRAAAGCQFSFACGGQPAADRDSEAWRRSRLVAERALNGAVVAGVGDATHFHVGQGSSWAAGLMKVAQIGAHAFFRFTGHAMPAFHAAAPAREIASAESPRTVMASFSPIAFGHAAPAAAAPTVAQPDTAPEATKAAGDAKADASKTVSPPPAAASAPAQPAPSPEPVKLASAQTP